MKELTATGLIIVLIILLISHLLTQVSNTCLDGVVYYKSYHKLTPAYNPDSTVKTCDI